MGITVVRLDSLKGVQLRYGKSLSRGYRSEFFAYGQYGGIQEALDAATRREKEIIEQHPEYLSRPYNTVKQRNNLSGVIGVYFYQYRKNRKSTTVHHYWGASYHYLSPTGEKLYRHRRWSVAKYGNEEAYQRAVAFRKAWEKAMEKGYDEVDRFLTRGDTEI